MAKRIDKVFFPGMMVRKMYTLAINDGQLFMLKTGPGIPLKFQDHHKKALKELTPENAHPPALAGIIRTEQSLNELSYSSFVEKDKDSYAVPLTSISEVKYKKSIGVSKLRFKAEGKKFKFDFLYNLDEDVDDFMTEFPQ